MPTFGSLFAEVGGFDLGFEAAGWLPRWQVEWDRNCQSVLARRWPKAERFADVRDVDGMALTPADCITYGFPCQDLSVAGRRAGLDGDRSNLFFEAVRIIEEMRDATGGQYPTFAVAENVPGLLSADGGTAMGRCLDALADIGAVGIEWAVLDAQHFGVPQRRRRVFIVAWWDPRICGGGPLLPVGESCSGHSATGGETRQDVAGSSARSVDASRGLGSVTDAGIAQSLLTPTGGVCVPDAQEGHLIPAITDPSRLDDQATGQLVPAWVKARRAQSEDDYETWETDRPALTLNAFDNGTESRATVLAWSERTRDGISTLEVEPSNRFPALKTGTQRQQGIGVRRLTPRECERLMGWPDDHTRWAADGSEIADTNRYKMCGNGVVAPVAKWIAERLMENM